MMIHERDRQLLEMINTQHGKGKATKGSLRQELALQNQKNSYEFDFDGKRQSKTSEVLLAAQDIFYANRLALYLIREESGKEGTGELFSYIDATVFAAATGFVPAHLNVIWNGRIQCQLGTKVIMESFSSRLFHKRAEELLDRDGSVDLEPALILYGQEKNKLSLILPTFAGIQIQSIVTGTDNKVVLIADGFLVTGVAK